MRDRPPPIPYLYEDPDEAVPVSLLMTSYDSDPISAYDLSSCLADGFTTAAEKLAGMHRLAPILNNRFFCDMQDVEILVVNDPTLRAHNINYLDLAMIMQLIQEFHLDYMMPNILFDIEYLATRTRRTMIGQGSVVWKQYRLGGANATAST